MSNSPPFVTIVAAGIATTEDMGKCVEEPAFMNHISMAATDAQHACTVPVILCHKQANLSESNLLFKAIGRLTCPLGVVPSLWSLQ